MRLRFRAVRYALVHKQLSKTTINRYLSVLGNALRCAGKLGLISFVPHAQKLKYRARESYVFSEADYRKWLDCSPEPLKSMSALARFTGMRHSEILALQKDSVFLWNQPDHHGFCGEIVVCSAKRDRYRTLKLNGELRDVLRGIISRSKCQHAFTSPTDPARPFSASALAHQVSQARKKGGFAKDAGLHALRVTCLVKLAQVADLSTVAWFAGYRSIRTTERFIPYLPNQNVPGKPLGCSDLRTTSRSIERVEHGTKFEEALRKLWSVFRVWAVRKLAHLTKTAKPGPSIPSLALGGEESKS